MSIQKLPIYQSFVDPQHCVELWQAGMMVQTSFMWRRNANENSVNLFTSLFDPDNYYEQAAANLQFVNETTMETFAAFQLGDMETILPDYTVCRTGKEYALCMGVEWRTECVTADRLPDAFALMVIQLHNERKIDLKKATLLITKK